MRDSSVGFSVARGCVICDFKFVKWVTVIDCVGCLPSLSMSVGESKAKGYRGRFRDADESKEFISASEPPDPRSNEQKIFFALVH
jgi:hypothetical protein